MPLHRFVPGALSASIYLTSANPIARIIYSLVSLVPLILVSALVLQSLWGWYIIPLWPRPISYREAAGIMWVLLFLRGVTRLDSTPSESGDLWSQLQRSLFQIVAMALFWCVAAAFHLLLL